MSETTTGAPSPEPVAAAEAPAPEAAAPAVEVGFAAHTETPTLLESAELVPAPVAEPAPEAAAAEAPAAEPAPAEPVAPTEPAVYAFTLPEGLQAAPEQIEAYTGMLREANVSPEVGQKLLDMHIAAVTRLTENTLAQQHETFAATRRGWAQEIKADPELGGPGFETTKRAVARARDMMVPQKDRAEFDKMLAVTGVGDHPAFWRALYRVAQRYDEPVPVANPRPSPTANPAPKTGVMGLFDRKMSNSFA